MPWTLPNNLALRVNESFVYVKVRNKYSGKVLVVAKSCLSGLPAEKPKTEVLKGSTNLNPKNKGSSASKSKNAMDYYELLEKIPGKSLVGVHYKPLFNYFMEFSDVAFKVVSDNYVTDDTGTGIVHCAPAFGEDDCRVCIENKIINKGENLIVAVDDDGCFSGKITDFSGRYVKDADKDIIEAVKKLGRLIKSGRLTHSYPFCWRSDTPLIYRGVPNWFVAVETSNSKLIGNE